MRPDKYTSSLPEPTVLLELNTAKPQALCTRVQVCKAASHVIVRTLISVNLAHERETTLTKALLSIRSAQHHSSS